MTAEEKITNPERIYLQGEESNPAWPDRTWCVDRIGDDDTEYARADLVTRRDEVIKSLVEVVGCARETWCTKRRDLLRGKVRPTPNLTKLITEATAALALARDLEEG